MCVSCDVFSARVQCVLLIIIIVVVVLLLLFLLLFFCGRIGLPVNSPFFLILFCKVHRAVSLEMHSQKLLSIGSSSSTLVKPV